MKFYFEIEDPVTKLEMPVQIEALTAEVAERLVIDAITQSRDEAINVSQSMKQRVALEERNSKVPNFVPYSDASKLSRAPREGSPISDPDPKWKIAKLKFEQWITRKLSGSGEAAPHFADTDGTPSWFTWAAIFICTGIIVVLGYTGKL